MTNAWAYLVVSSDAQADTLDFQEAWAQSTTAEHGWTLSRIFSGVSSGKDGTRKLLHELLDALRSTPKSQRPSRILMIRLDRTGRGMGIDSLAAIAEIHKLGAVIHTREDGDLKLERAADAVLPFMRVFTGALENEARSDKWKAVVARRKAAGLHVGNVPFGIVVVDGRAVAYEPEAAIVRELFTKAAQGWGYQRLGRWARQRSTTKVGSDGVPKPYSWGITTVRRLLVATTLRGVVVPEDLWQAVQHRSRFRLRPAVHPWPLRGAVRCTCGRLLVGHNTGRSGGYRYYACRPHPGGMVRHGAKALEASFFALLERLGAAPELWRGQEPGGQLDRLKRREKALADQLAENDRRRRRVWELEDQLSGSQVRERLDELEADRSAVRAQLEDARAELAAIAEQAPQIIALSSVVAGLAQRWLESPLDLQQQMARAVAALPIVDGLWADPARRGQVLTGPDCARLHVSCVTCYQPPRERLFPGKLLALMREHGISGALRSEVR